MKMLSDVLLEEFLGEGSFGKVFRARLSNHNTQYACKVFPTLKIDSNEFLNEARAIKSISHACFPKFIGICTTNLGPGIVTELIEGKDLIDCIKQFHNSKSTLSPQKIVDTKLNILNQIALGIKHLHDQKKPILHRDLSGDNIRVTKLGRVFILDLGLAKNLAQDKTQTKTEQFQGKIAYSAPEVLMNLEHSKESDLYSFGVLAYELFAESLVFRDVTESKVLALKLEQTPPRPDQLVDKKYLELWKALESLLSKDRKIRRKGFEFFLQTSPEYQTSTFEVIFNSSTASTIRPIPKIKNYTKSQLNKRTMLLIVLVILVISPILIYSYSQYSRFIYFEIVDQNGIKSDLSPKKHDAMVIEAGLNNGRFLTSSCELACNRTLSDLNLIFEATAITSLKKNKSTADDSIRTLGRANQTWMLGDNAIFETCGFASQCKNIEEIVKKLRKPIANLADSSTPVADLNAIKRDPKLTGTFNLISKYLIEVSESKIVSSQLSDLLQISIFDTRPLTKFIIGTIPLDHMPKSPTECSQAGDYLFLNRFLPQGPPLKDSIRILLIPDRTGEILKAEGLKLSILRNKDPNFLLPKTGYCYYEIQRNQSAISLWVTPESVQKAIQ